MDELTRATEVLRDISGEDPELAAATRRRLRGSLEQRPRGRRRVSSLLAALGIGLGATTAFAFATGQAQRVWSALVDDPAPAPAPAPAAPSAPARSRVATQITPPAPAPVPAPAITEPAPAITAPAEPVTTLPAPTAPRPRPTGPRPRIASSRTPATPATPQPASATEIEALYRKAHELHFRGQDPVAALRAWDAYLTAEPSGRFAVEARYNRALLLVRLGRYREAREALAPFARGEVANAYRREEAQRLLDRLSRLNER